MYLADSECQPLRNERNAPSSGDYVLMLAFHFPPIAAAGSFRSLRFAKYLPHFGWTPIVVSLLPEYSAEAIDLSLVSSLPADGVYHRTPIMYLEDRANRFAKWFISTGASDTVSDVHSANVRGTRTKVLLRHARDFVFRTPDPEIAWKKHALRAATRLIKEFRPKVIYSTGPPHSTHLIAAQIKRAYQLPWIADFRDPWSRMPWAATVYTDNPWGRRLQPHFERTCVTLADAVVLNTRRMLRDFVQHYSELPPNKFHVIYNGYDPELLPAIHQLANSSVHSAGRRVLRICHPGTLYGQRDLRPFIQAIRILTDENIAVQFEQIGHVEQRFHLDRQIADQKLAHMVTLRGHLAHMDALKCMAAADILLNIQPDTELQVPGKLFEMLMFRRPILALTGGGETADIVARHGIGETAPADDVTAIAQAIKRLRNCRLQPEVWHQALDEFDGRRLTGELAALLSVVSNIGSCRGKSAVAC